MNGNYATEAMGPFKAPIVYRHQGISGSGYHAVTSIEDGVKCLNTIKDVNV